MAKVKAYKVIPDGSSPGYVGWRFKSKKNCNVDIRYFIRHRVYQLSMLMLSDSKLDMCVVRKFKISNGNELFLYYRTFNITEETMEVIRYLVSPDVLKNTLNHYKNLENA